jgi:two-component system, sensor histidine kinase PdtaS
MTHATRNGWIELKPGMAKDLREENDRLQAMLEKANATAESYSMLLREGNHRIKNSLQIVSSLMSMQARNEESPTARHALQAAMARIQSIAKMHDVLQASGGADSVNIGVVLRKMCASLQAMGGYALGVEVRVEAEAIHTPVAYAQPILLAVNELVVNALRHAFPDGRAGSILVRLHSEGGQMHVLVADNGVGLPAGHAEEQGYGMKLVRMMASQINGVLCITSDGGTRVSIISPEPQPATGERTVTRKAGRVTDFARTREPLGLLARKPWKASGRG